MKEKIIQRIVYIFVALLALGMLIMALTSCRTSGYGCHGTSKWITGIKPDKWERKYNKGY